VATPRKTAPSERFTISRPWRRAKRLPYGAYEIGDDRAVVNVGVTHDTAEFAVGKPSAGGGNWPDAKRKPGAKRILICADAGGR